MAIDLCVLSPNILQIRKFRIFETEEKKKIGTTAITSNKRHNTLSSY
jgi:hypothetical protein